MVDPYWIGAQICAVIASVNAAKGKRFAIQDFLPRVCKAKAKAQAQQSTEEMLAVMQGMN